MSDELDTIFDDAIPENHRSGFVAVVGRPNVGKSTLINTILGQKIAIVTPKPQTTRQQQLGIYTTQDLQILFMDTPGIHKPYHKMGEYMVKVAENTLHEADVILWIVDASEAPDASETTIAETIQKVRGETPLILALNKVDLGTKPEFLEQYQALGNFQQMVQISALTHIGIEELLAKIVEYLPLGPRYYPIEQITNTNMRFTAAEVIREKIIENTEQEIPHSVAVEVEEYKEGADRVTISAIIYVEKESQKGILVGKGGSMIKTIGTAARRELKQMLEQPVHLDLRVKVLEKWRSDERLMKRLGYHIPKDSHE